MTWGAFAWTVIVGGGFATRGVFQLRSALRPIVFDRRAGFYWRGKDAQGNGRASGRKEQRVPLADIAALQILSEAIGKRGASTSHELNLVLASGERLNVVDHGNRRALEADAAALAQFLGVPVLSGAESYAYATEAA